MTFTNEDLPWECGSDTYVPISCERSVVGFCKPDYAKDIVETLNQEARLRKALRLACLDLLKKTGGDQKKVGELMKKYIALGERPKSGPRAIAVLLRERQAQLQVSSQEFVKFCDIHKLAPQDLKTVYAGKEIDESLVPPIARILGITPAEVMDVLYGHHDD